MFQDHADLASVSTLEEHRFISAHLNLIDPQHRRWYISTRQEDQNRWVNLGDQVNNRNKTQARRHGLVIKGEDLQPKGCGFESW